MGSQHMTQALVLLGTCANMSVRQALNTSVGRSVRAGWVGWDRSANNEFALSQSCCSGRTQTPPRKDAWRADVRPQYRRVQFKTQKCDCALWAFGLQCLD